MNPPHLFDDLFRNLPLAAAAFDRSMNYIAHNDAWLAAHGSQSSLPLVGLSHYDVFPEIKADWRDIHQRCLDGATQRKDHDTFVDAGGVTHEMRWMVAPWWNDDASVGGIIIYVEDLSEQRLTERRLEERESFIRDFFERSPLGLNLCTMEGLWLESNPAFLDIVGYSREEADGGLTYWQLTPKEYHAEEAAQLESLRVGHRYGPYEKEFIHKNGSRVPVRLNGFIVERDGKEYIWSLVENLTAQRELERRVEAEQAMALSAAKLATLGEMAAGIAHEVNNPLAIIGGYAFTLRGAIAAGDGAAIAEGLAAIDAATERAAQIIRSLRKFSRGGAGGARENVDVATLVTDAYDLSRARAQSLGIQLTTDVGLAAHVRANAGELSQVLINLLNNAFDATQGSAQPRVHVSASKDDDGWIEIRVDNSGAPIEPSVLPNMFLAFFTTKVSGEGTGLGLSISRTIVEAHGGSLEHTPEAEHTRFVVRLPEAR